MDPVGYVGLGRGSFEGLRPAALGRGLVAWNEEQEGFERGKGMDFGD